MKRSTERALRAWILVLAYLVLIFGVSSIPSASLSHTIFKVSDKVAHAAEYTGFGLLLTLALRGSLRRAPRWAIMIAVIVLGASVGVLDEVYQLTVPGRESDVLDWMADVLGITLGLIAAVGLDAIVGRRRAAGEAAR